MKASITVALATVVLLTGCAEQWEGVIYTSSVPYNKDYGNSIETGRGKFSTYADCEKAMITASKQVADGLVTSIPPGYFSRVLEYSCQQGKTMLPVRKVSFLLPIPTL